MLKVIGYTPCTVCNPYNLVTTSAITTNNKKDDTGITEITNFIDFPASIANFLLYVIFYFAIPVFLIFIRFSWNSKKEVILFILAHNSYIFLFLSILNLLSSTLNVFDVLLPFISGFINYFLLIQHIEEPIYTTEIISQKQQWINESMPMNWLNFNKYFRFPIGILLAFVHLIGTLNNSIQTATINNIYVFFLMISEIILLILLCINFYYFIHPCKEGYRLTLIMLSFGTMDSVIGAFNNINSMHPVTFFISFCFIFAIMAIIWIYPNYIYYKKRKFYFGLEDEEDTIEYDEE